MTAWLKVIGTSGWPLRDDWGSHAPPLLKYASFSKRPGEGSFVPGDDFVYYAIGEDRSRVVAIGAVRGRPRYDRAREESPGWPWLIDVDIEARKTFIRDGIPLDHLDVDRELKRSVRRHSHIRLTAHEFARARKEFGLA